MATDRWYAVVDTARDDRLYPLVIATAKHSCLVSGEVDTVLAATLPYLVELRRGEELADVWEQHARGNGLGITVRSPLPLDELRRHLKKFLTARMPDGQLALFRFYDPMVLTRFLRDATPEQASALFKGVDLIVADGDDQGTSVSITCSPDGRAVFANG